jgi:hypothetical protein
MIPNTYSDWCKIFDNIDTWEIGHIDEKLLTSMEKGYIDWVDGVSQRITLRLINLVNNRLKKLSEFYNKRLSVSCSSFDLTNILLTFRKELIFIKRLDNLPMLPEELRKELTKDVLDYAQKTQKSLESSAKKDLSGELKRILLSYKVDNI